MGAALGAMILLAGCSGPAKAPVAGPKPGAAADPPVVEVSAKQRDLVNVSPVGERPFVELARAVGSIDFNGDRSVAVFTPYQGRIIAALAQLGDTVHRGQPLFTVQSPDLLQAESTLIAAAGVLELQNRALARARQLYGQQGLSQKDLDQAISDQMTAEGALKAAREAVLVFGKSPAEVDRMVAQRKVDPVLIVRSPIEGRVTARNAQPGLLVQPGSAPAPYSIADISTMWMLAQASEADASRLQAGQPVEVQVEALPGHTFEGRIATVAQNLDPSIHTLQVRSEISDPEHRLKAGMLANFAIRTSRPFAGLAAPADAVVREPDGTLTAWVTKDGRRFTQRVVRVGLVQDGYDQVLAGLDPGDLIATKGAVFLDNMLNTTPDD